MSKILELNHTGDELVIEWDPNDPKQQKAAEKAFKALKKRGCMIYKAKPAFVTVPTSHMKGEQVHELPAAASVEKEDKFVARPAMSGG